MAVDSYARSLASAALNSNGGSQSGTSDYMKLTNKPRINGIELNGDTELESLKDVIILDIDNNGRIQVSTDEQKQKLSDAIYKYLPDKIDSVYLRRLFVDNSSTEVCYYPLNGFNITGKSNSRVTFSLKFGDGYADGGQVVRNGVKWVRTFNEKYQFRFCVTKTDYEGKIITNVLNESGTKTTELNNHYTNASIPGYLLRDVADAPLGAHNTDVYVPSERYNPATKGYVDDMKEAAITEAPQLFMDGFYYMTSELEDVDVNYEVLNSDTEPQFVLDEDGFYSSSNKGVGNSFAYCRVRFMNTHFIEVPITYMHEGEGACDFAQFSQLDKELNKTTNVDNDPSIVKLDLRGIVETKGKEIVYQIPAGEHFITIKYKKDGTVDRGMDCLRFKVPDTVKGHKGIFVHGTTQEYVDNKIALATSEEVKSIFGFDFDIGFQYLNNYPGVNAYITANCEPNPEYFTVDEWGSYHLTGDLMFDVSFDGFALPRSNVYLSKETGDIGARYSIYFSTEGAEELIEHIFENNGTMEGMTMDANIAAGALIMDGKRSKALVKSEIIPQREGA